MLASRSSANVTAEGEPEHGIADDRTSSQGNFSKILRLNASQGLGRVFRMMAELPARPLPDLVSSMLDPQRNPRSCCFDTASRQSSWCARVICKRCFVLNSLMQSEYTTPPAAVS